MSRIGNKHIVIPAGVEVNVNKNVITTKGAKGSLSLEFASILKVEVKDNEIIVSRPNDEKETKALHGTTRANIQNLVIGVSTGFKKVLQIEGVGYKAQMQGAKLIVYGGYSHTVDFDIPAGLTVTCPDQLTIVIEGMDKQLVGEFAANVRKVRKPEPYKGKGIHYEGEYIRRKEGKKAK